MSWLYCPGVAKNTNTRYLRSFPFILLIGKLAGATFPESKEAGIKIKLQ
jgi:hypothetical protein